MIFILVVSFKNLSLANSIVAYETNIVADETGRIIPTYIYHSNIKNNLPVIIINHGYTIKNTEYSFIANRLAALGYLVVSIQHNLKSDPPLAKITDIYKRREPMWKRGVQNISSVINYLKESCSFRDSKKIILIGHSNGGDISMMFAALYPQLVEKIISLDSLRYPFIDNYAIPVLTLRANDTVPDKKIFSNNSKNLQIITLNDVKHIDMCDRGSSKSKNQVINKILNFLKN